MEEQATLAQFIEGELVRCDNCHRNSRQEPIYDDPDGAPVATGAFWCEHCHFAYVPDNRPVRLATDNAHELALLAVLAAREAVDEHTANYTVAREVAVTILEAMLKYDARSASAVLDR